jgi:hypothetical protein
MLAGVIDAIDFDAGAGSKPSSDGGRDVAYHLKSARSPSHTNSSKAKIVQVTRPIVSEPSGLSDRAGEC